MNKFSFLIVISFFYSCVDSDKKQIPVVVEPKISKVNFFMETSGSMAGYLEGATDFRNDIPNLLVEINGKINPLHTYFIADSVLPFNGTTQEFINTIALRSPANGKSSQMHKIFEMIAKRTDSNDISMFVSDCILSYPDEEIRKNREINSINAAGELKSTMTNAFLNLRAKNNMCASLYGFTSAFNGNYYTYQNTPLKIKGNIDRPYYIWVIGNKELLIKFNKQLKDLQVFKPDNISMDFGIFSDPIEDYSILFSLGRKGDWSTDYKQLENVKATTKDAAIFSVAVDLSSLPGYASDTNYLRSNLRISSEGIDLHITRVLLAKSIDRSKLKEKEKGIIDKSTHVFEITISDIYKSGTIQLSLPLQYDTSYRNQSIMDDRDVAGISGKTFSFEHLVDGVRNAYQNNSQNFIHLSIPVKK